jgi:biopolymer transport protein TolR
MAMAVNEDEDVISGINVTPLVDIVLVVLIVFIVTASMVMRNTIPIDLPSVQTGQQSTSAPIILALTKDGQLYINGQPKNMSDISQAVRAARELIAAETATQTVAGAGTKAVSAFVSADQGASYGAFARVIDQLRLDGVVDIALDTQPVAVAQE